MTELWVERTGVRRYTGRSSRGAEVLVGCEDVDGVFTPGELMKIALAACSGMSSDHPLQRRLGDDYDTTIRVSGPADREQERYPLLDRAPRTRPVRAVRGREGAGADGRRARDRPGLHRGPHAQVRYQSDV